MERKPGGHIVLTDSRECYATFHLQLCMQYLNSRKARQAGRLYDKVVSLSGSHDITKYVPVELNRRQARQLSKLTEFVCSHSDEVRSAASQIDSEEAERFRIFSKSVSEVPSSSYSDQAATSLESVEFLRDQLAV
jgi:hypothetical protein